MTVRVAVAVGYLGRGYSGSQVQPNVPTVQGELEAALIRLNWCEHGTHPVTLSSRTDGGVDARMNIGSFDIPEQVWNGVGERGVITALNDLIPTDIRVWAAQSVDSDLRTRDAHSRTYLYRLQALQGWPEVTISDLTSWFQTKPSSSVFPFRQKVSFGTKSAALPLLCSESPKADFPLKLSERPFHHPRMQQILDALNQNG